MGGQIAHPRHVVPGYRHGDRAIASARRTARCRGSRLTRDQATETLKDRQSSIPPLHVLVLRLPYGVRTPVTDTHNLDGGRVSVNAIYGSVGPTSCRHVSRQFSDELAECDSAVGRRTALRGGPHVRVNG